MQICSFLVLNILNPLQCFGFPLSKFFPEWIQKRAPEETLYHPHLAVQQELASYENANRIKSECSKKNISLLTPFKLFCPNPQLNVYRCKNKLSPCLQTHLVTNHLKHNTNCQAYGGESRLGKPSEYSASSF